VINLTSQPADRAPVLITGGAQRLGLATAQALHHEGYPVVITYRKHYHCHN